MLDAVVILQFVGLCMNKVGVKKTLYYTANNEAAPRAHDHLGLD